jgi:hypothetical protein
MPPLTWHTRAVAAWEDSGSAAVSFRELERHCRGHSNTCVAKHSHKGCAMEV